MSDLIERLRGPVREAASRLIAGSFRRDGERLDEKRPRFSIPARPDEDDDLVLIAAIEEAAAALEAEASEGERLRALLTDIHRTSPKPFRLDRPGLTHGQAAEIGYGALRDAIQTRVAVALIPEAPPPPSQDRDPDSQRGAK